jgi:hypothetical protein
MTDEFYDAHMHSSMVQPFTRTIVHKCLGTGTAFGGIFDLPCNGWGFNDSFKRRLFQDRWLCGNLTDLAISSRRLYLFKISLSEIGWRECMYLGSVFRGRLFRGKGLLDLVHSVCGMTEDLYMAWDEVRHAVGSRRGRFEHCAKRTRPKGARH